MNSPVYDVELVFALVAPIGTYLDPVGRQIRSFLETAGFYARIIHLSKNFDLSPEERAEPDGRKLYLNLMDYGDEQRRATGNNAAVAGIAVGRIKKIRRDCAGISKSGAVIIRQLKHPDEIDRLRKIYGTRLIVVSCHSGHGNRVATLSRKLAEHAHEVQISRFRAAAEELISRDEADSSRPWGQNVRKTFPKADVFVDVDDQANLEPSLRRALEIFFNHPFHTPTKDEYGMFLAEGASLRSAALGRQVGAVITNEGGDIVSVGSNEVPKAGGGMYWEGDSPDLRDCSLEYDSNDRFKEKLLGEIVRRLIKARWIKKKRAAEGVDKMVDDLLYASDAVLAGSQVDNIIEFGRCVHAEMAAIVDAARRGTGVDQGVLYTTTFPCHECARHIVAAGIKRVVYRLPYAKSLVRELYPDSIDIDGGGSHASRVAFEPFVGIAPQRYSQLFTMGIRKSDKGSIVRWSPINAKPNLGTYFPDHELIERDEDLFLIECQDGGLQHES